MTFLVRAFSSTFSRFSRVIPVVNRGKFVSVGNICGSERRVLRAFVTAPNQGGDIMAGLPNESEILGKNEGREEALTEVINIIEECDKVEAEKKAAPAPEKKEVVKQKEPEVKKLSAAEFRAYNSMAEHMEYFVSPMLPHICI